MNKSSSAASSVVSSAVAKIAALLAAGYNPVVVSSGEVDIIVKGGQNFGSGGYSASGGNIGGEIVSNVRQDSQFTTNVRRSIRMSEGAVAWHYAYDCIGEGREWRKLYICMSDKDIQSARQIAWQIECKEAAQERRNDKARKGEASVRLYNELIEAGAPTWGARAISSDVGNTEPTSEDVRRGWKSYPLKCDNLYDLGGWAVTRAQYARKSKLDQEWDDNLRAEELAEIEELVPQATQLHASGWLAQELSTY